MNASLYLRNRQRRQHIDRRFLSRIVRSLLRDDLHIDDFELGIFLVGAEAMAKLNQRHLRHSGPTDVITFDYGDPAQPRWLAGDIFLCLPVAVEQSTVFRVPWQQELVRYIVHGILHLLGHDDHDPAKRAAMKKVENRLVRTLVSRFRLSRIEKKP